MMLWKPVREGGTKAPMPQLQYLVFFLVILDTYREFDEWMELVEGKRPALEVVQQATEWKLGKFMKRNMINICPTLSKTLVESSIKKLVDNGAFQLNMEESKQIITLPQMTPADTLSVKFENNIYVADVHFIQTTKDTLEDKIKHLMLDNVKVANFETKIRKIFPLNILTTSPQGKEEQNEKYRTQRR